MAIQDILWQALMGSDYLQQQNLFKQREEERRAREEAATTAFERQKELKAIKPPLSIEEQKYKKAQTKGALTRDLLARKKLREPTETPLKRLQRLNYEQQLREKGIDITTGLKRPPKSTVPASLLRMLPGMAKISPQSQRVIDEIKSSQDLQELEADREYWESQGVDVDYILNWYRSK